MYRFNCYFNVLPVPEKRREKKTIYVRMHDTFFIDWNLTSCSPTSVPSHGIFLLNRIHTFQRPCFPVSPGGKASTSKSSLVSQGNSRSSEVLERKHYKCPSVRNSFQHRYLNITDIHKYLTSLPTFVEILKPIINM